MSLFPACSLLPDPRLVMTDTDFEYDVAVSFLWEDHALAQTLKRRLGDSLRVFVASEEQHALGGEDGLERFTPLFETQSRVGVLLFRPEWATTPWTRVEEGAIKSRGLAKGWDFLLVVLLDPPSRPVWYPAPRIWMTYTGRRSQADSIAGAIRQKAIDRSAEVRELSFVEKAQREARRRDQETRRRGLLCSDQGNQLAAAERDKLFDLIASQAAAVSGASPPIRIDVEKTWQQLVMWHDRNSIELFWEGPGNNCTGNQLWVRDYDGLKSLDHARRSQTKPQVQRSEAAIKFDYRDDRPCWNTSAEALNPSGVLSSVELADSLLEQLWQMKPRKVWRSVGPLDPFV